MIPWRQGRVRLRVVCVTLFVALVCSCALTASAGAADDGEEYREKSVYGPIQKRLYDLDNELSLGFAYLPLNPYYKGYGVSLSYTYHFNHLLALELFRVGWSWNLDTPLKTKLVEQMPDVSLEQFPAVVFFENTNLVLKVLYGKQTLLNRAVLHFEVFVTAGAAFVFRNPFNVTDLDDENIRLDFGVNAGVGFRFWLDPTWSMRVDLRDTVLLLGLNRPDIPLRNSAEIGLSLSVNL